MAPLFILGRDVQEGDGIGHNRVVVGFDPMPADAVTALAYGPARIARMSNGATITVFDRYAISVNRAAA